MNSLAGQRSRVAGLAEPSGTVQVPVLAWGHARLLFKLSHKVQFIFITAEGGKGMNGHFRGPQVIFCLLDPGGNDILDAGDTEKKDK